MPRACATATALQVYRKPLDAVWFDTNAFLRVVVMTSSIPVLETERLILRGPRPEDLDDCTTLWREPDVIRYISGKPASREEVWARLLRYLGHWQVNGYGFWQIRERATDRFVGECGLADFKRDIAVDFAGAPEAGWALMPWSHGKGYATEAAAAALVWIAAAHPRTVCIIDPENTPSLRVAGKLGFREFARTQFKGNDTIVFERRA